MTNEEREIEFERLERKYESLTEAQKKLVNDPEKYCVSEYNGVLTKIYFDGRKEIIQPNTN